MSDLQSRIGVALVALLFVATISCGDSATEPQIAPPPLDPHRATTVTVGPASATLTALGDTVRLTARVQDQNGQLMAGAAVNWTSSHASVATVNASGLVTARSDGEALITATSGTASGGAAITIEREASAVVVTPA